MMATIMRIWTTEKLIRIAWTDCKGIWSYVLAHSYPLSFRARTSISRISIINFLTIYMQKRKIPMRKRICPWQ